MFRTIGSRFSGTAVSPHKNIQLKSIYDKYGFQVLDRTLGLIIGTWEGTRNSFSANMLNGIARLINSYGDLLKDTIFKVKCGRISLKEISRTAKELRAGSLGFAEALLIFYNKKSHFPLKWEKLYIHKNQHTLQPSTPDTKHTSYDSINPEAEDIEGQLDIFNSYVESSNE